jgi:cytochrome c oxidase subunit II
MTARERPRTQTCEGQACHPGARGLGITRLSAGCYQVRFRAGRALNRAIECRAVTRATFARIIAAIVVLTAVMAVPMTQIHWNGTEASAQADDIDTLLNVMIILSSFVFAIVLVMLGYCVWKYRAKPGDESDGEPIHGNTKLEITWTVIPTVIVLFGAIYSWIVLGDIESEAADSMHIDVTAQQYEWTFNYPQDNGKVVSSKILEVPVNTQLDLKLTALDVLHSFWVPEWRIKRDLVPKGPGGNDVDDTVVVTPDKVGTYNVVCTELCGYGHATMRALVKVVPQEEFDKWLGNQPLVTPTPGSPESSSTLTESPDQAAEGGSTTTNTTGSG